LQHIELPDERTARWLTLHVYFVAAGTLRLDSLGFISSQDPADVRGSFRASDPRIALIVQLTLEHALVSMSDTYVDTPGREDGQWLENARLRAQLAAQWFGDIRLRQLFLAWSRRANSPTEPSTRSRRATTPSSPTPTGPLSGWALCMTIISGLARQPASRLIGPRSRPSGGTCSRPSIPKDPDMVAHNADGQILTVQYQKLTPMLLNEVQKLHRQVEAQQKTIEKLEAQQKTVEMLEQRLFALESAAPSSNSKTP
jgi:hypothetical protein